jgi:hypothetical protein
MNGAGARAIPASWTMMLDRRPATRTGGPDDDDDEAAMVRKLMPIVAVLVIVSALFG